MDCPYYFLDEYNMKQRIKELALECYNPYSNFDHEKFAELIVKECLDFLEKDAADAPDNSETQAALLSCALDILDHFDIEL